MFVLFALTLSSKVFGVLEKFAQRKLCVCREKKRCNIQFSFNDLLYADSIITFFLGHPVLFVKTENNVHFVI